MGMVDDLTADVINILKTRWQWRQGRGVPEAEEMALANKAVKLYGTVLYADLAESTKLVKSQSPDFAAMVYKSYLYCASKIIEKYEGTITAFDGDRAMAVYVGKKRNTNAVRTALAINHAVVQIINPQIEKKFRQSGYVVRHSVGVDTSQLFIAKTGIRHANDLVWVGRAANYAAKLCSRRDSNYATWITANVFKMRLFAFFSGRFSQFRQHAGENF